MMHKIKFGFIKVLCHYLDCTFRVYLLASFYINPEQQTYLFYFEIMTIRWRIKNHEEC